MTALSVLFNPLETGLSLASEHWCVTRDGDPLGYEIYRRHYSSKKNKRPKQRKFVGPGERLVLISPEGNALFVWRKERFRLDSQIGVNCAVFRNESHALSSDMILEAQQLAWDKWPNARLYTFINGEAVRSSNPGYCFLMAGWQRCGVTKGGLMILERLP